MAKIQRSDREGKKYKVEVNQKALKSVKSQIKN